MLEAGEMPSDSEWKWIQKYMHPADDEWDWINKYLHLADLACGVETPVPFRPRPPTKNSTDS